MLSRWRTKSHAVVSAVLVDIRCRVTIETLTHILCLGTHTLKATVNRRLTALTEEHSISPADVQKTTSKPIDTTASHPWYDDNRNASLTSPDPPLLDNSPRHPPESAYQHRPLRCPLHYHPVSPAAQHMGHRSGKVQRSPCAQVRPHWQRQQLGTVELANITRVKKIANTHHKYSQSTSPSASNPKTTPPPLD